MNIFILQLFGNVWVGALNYINFIFKVIPCKQEKKKTQNFFCSQTNQLSQNYTSQFPYCTGSLSGREIIWFTFIQRSLLHFLFLFTETCNMLLEIYWHTKMPADHAKIGITSEICCNPTLFLLTDRSSLLYALHNRLFSTQELALSLQWCMFLHLSSIFR